ncbi:MAG: efflux RND transporter periplasmic adaptor subunit [Bacteroidales bacterium]|jgi:HlyD family secretion protein|nr:efflux RND transporter periplasmic adaptor subunit [Bacteroidales bacterium]
MKKKYIWIGVIVILALIGLWQYLGSRKQSSKIAFKTARVETGVITNYVTATGTIEPVVKVEVGTQVSGIVKKLYVDYNSVVKKGQVIAELDKTNLQSEYQSQQSNLAKAQSDYNYQKSNHDRMKTLHDKGLIADNEYEAAVQSFQSAKSSLSVASQNLQKAKTNLSYATITSPIDGVVLSKSVEEGQTVAASFSTPTLFYIANNLTQMRVIASVDEADIGSVLEGQRVEFTVDAYVGETFNGTVTQVRQNATTTNNVVTYEVVVDAPNPELKLKPGLTANITIYTKESGEVLTVQPKALKFNPLQYDGVQGYSIDPASREMAEKRMPKGQGILWTLDGKVFKARQVTTGMSSKIATEVSGVREGDVIVLEASTEEQVKKSASSEGNSPFMPKRPGAGGRR